MNDKRENFLDKKELEFMLNKLTQMDEDIDLRIKGIKDLIIQEKNISNKNMKKIQSLKEEIEKTQRIIRKEKGDNNNNLKSIQNEFDFNNAFSQMKNNNYQNKINAEIKTQRDLLMQIAETKNKIEQYHHLISSCEKIEQLEEKEIQKENEEMIKFISSI